MAPTRVRRAASPGTAPPVAAAAGLPALLVPALTPAGRDPRPRARVSPAALADLARPTDPAPQPVAGPDDAMSVALPLVLAAVGPGPIRAHRPGPAPAPGVPPRLASLRTRDVAPA